MAVLAGRFAAYNCSRGAQENMTVCAVPDDERPSLKPKHNSYLYRIGLYSLLLCASVFNSSTFFYSGLPVGSPNAPFSVNQVLLVCL